MENEMETEVIMGYIRVILGLYRGYIGIMEKKMETTIYMYGVLYPYDETLGLVVATS